MIVDCPLADTKVRSDVFAWVTREHQVEDLPLTRGQACEASQGRLARCRYHGCTLWLFECAFDAAKQFFPADGLLNEVAGSCLHGLNSHWHIAVAGDHDRWDQMSGCSQMFEQIQTFHSWQVSVDQDARTAVWAIGGEKCFATRKISDGPAGVFQDHANGSTEVVVIVDDEDHRWIPRAGWFSRARSRYSNDRLRTSQQDLDRLRQF